MARPAAFAAGRTLVLAHRGLATRARENTVAAFRHAAAAGADGVELDVHATRDGHAVVHHDAVVEGAGAIVDLDLVDLRQLAPRVPTLSEALAAAEGLLVDIEIKNDPLDPGYDSSQRTARAVCDVFGGAPAPGVLVTSFDPAAVAAVRVWSPALATGLLAGQAIDPGVVLDVAVAAGHDAYLPPVPAARRPDFSGLIDTAHDAGLLVVVWTVNDVTVAAELARLGADALITDEPLAVLAAVR